MKITFKHEIKSDDKTLPDKIIKILLKNRSIKDVDDFLNPPSPLKITLSDFGYKKEIKKTLKLLKEIKERNQMIVVYTDYDADGITGGAILWETLHLLGFSVMPYVPHRKLEGYGFSTKGIDNVKKQFNPALIISVDHGITKDKEIQYAKSKGIRVIITDHHLKPDKLPTGAEAIFHIPELSGSGVSYFFSKMICDYFNDKKNPNYQLLITNYSVDYLALASIGTIADLVPLVGPSRSLVKYGLSAFPKVKRVGIKHILKEAGIENRPITPYEIGFIIAPRINAVGRLETALDALRLLCTKKEERAYHLAHHVGSKNRERQDLVKRAVEEAKKVISYQLTVNRKLPKVIILTSDKWHEGIIGLIAAKIAEEFYRPTIVLTKTDGFFKGSARSIPSFHIINFLRSLKEHLVDVGGHKQAAGFTIEKDKVDDFCTIVRQSSEKLLKDDDLEKTIDVDLKIPISKINLFLAKSLEKLQPFGIGNPQPTFYSQGELVDAKLFGKTNNHLKIFVKDTRSLVIPGLTRNPINIDSRFCGNDNIPPLELISFNQANQFTKLSRGEKIEVVYSIEVDRWDGNERLRGKIIFSIENR